MDEAPYHNVHHALKKAYRDQCIELMQKSKALSGLRGSTVRRSSGMTPWDYAAQSAITLSVIKRSVPSRMMMALDAYYSVPETKSLDAQKERNVVLLGEDIYLEVDRRLPKWLIVDWVREWAHGNPRVRHHNDKVWAAKLGVSTRTLRNWKHGRGSKPGVNNILSQRLTEAEGRASEALREAGLLGFDG